jgi:CheY-like chemotaxis protein
MLGGISDADTIDRPERASLEERVGREPTPILALTANALSHHAHAYAAAGMNGFIARPILLTIW